MAILVVQSVTYNTVYVYIDELDPTYNQDLRTVDWYIDGVYQRETVLLNQITQSSTIGFGDITPNSSHTITGYIHYTSGGVSYTATVQASFVTPPDPGPRPSTFSWDTPKVSGQPFSLTASEWNGLTTNINAVRRYRGLSNYSFSTAITNSSFTAAMYNQAVSAIQEMGGGSGLTTVSSGDDIYARYLTGLASSINAIS